MAPSAIDLMPHKDLIVKAIEKGASHQEVLELLEERNVRLSASTLRPRLSRWSVRSKLSCNQDTPTLRAIITHHFNVSQITEDESVRILNAKGIAVKKKTLLKIRKKMSLLKCLPPIRVADVPGVRSVGGPNLTS